jgi:lipooligosaccharide transport system permease protein
MWFRSVWAWDHTLVDRSSESIYVHFIAPGLVAVTAMNGVIFDVTFHLFAKVRFARLYEAVITTPLEPEDCALG